MLAEFLSLSHRSISLVLCRLLPRSVSSCAMTISLLYAFPLFLSPVSSGNRVVSGCLSRSGIFWLHNPVLPSLNREVKLSKYWVCTCLREVVGGAVLLGHWRTRLEHLLHNFEDPRWEEWFWMLWPQTCSAISRSSWERQFRKRAAAVGLVMVVFVILINMLFSWHERLFCSDFIYLLPLPAQVL